MGNKIPETTKSRESLESLPNPFLYRQIISQVDSVPMIIDWGKDRHLTHGAGLLADVHQLHSFLYP